MSAGDEGPDDWRRGAACGDEDPELFFPIGNTGPALVQIEEAKAVCRACPVLSQCRTFELTPVSGRLRNEDGVFAAMTAGERRAELRRRARARQKAARAAAGVAA